VAVLGDTVPSSGVYDLFWRLPFLKTGNLVRLFELCPTVNGDRIDVFEPITV
jgi:hypothetical protein